MNFAAIGSPSASRNLSQNQIIWQFTPLHTLDLNIVQSFNRYAVHDPGQVRLWKIVSIIGGPTVLRIAALLAVVLLEVRRRRDAAVLVAVAIGGPAALSGIVECWSTGAVNLRGKRHVCELFGRFGRLIWPFCR